MQDFWNEIEHFVWGLNNASQGVRGMLPREILKLTSSEYAGNLYLPINFCTFNFINLKIVFTEAFPDPPVLLYAYYSRLNLAMLGVAMLINMPRKFYVWGVFKNVYQKFGQPCGKIARVTS